MIKKHLSPCPRVELGQAIAKHHLATAMIDVSDGLLIDTSHLLEESGVGARIWEDRIPLSRLYRKWIHSFSKDPFQFALSGGEDYELLFTAPPEMRKRISSLCPFTQDPDHPYRRNPSQKRGTPHYQKRWKRLFSLSFGV